MLEMRMSSWEKAYLNDVEQFIGGDATHHLIPDEMCLHERHVIMWNLEDDNATDLQNFVPTYLVKVSNDIFEVMDDKDDMYFATLLNDSLSEMWGNEVRFPCANLFNTARITVFSSTDQTNALTVLDMR